MLLKAILLSLFAGIMNGSYAAFLKKVTLPTDCIWFIFSLLTFGLAPQSPFVVGYNLATAQAM
jgi:hypothetical protein